MNQDVTVYKIAQAAIKAQLVKGRWCSAVTRQGVTVDVEPCQVQKIILTVESQTPTKTNITVSERALVKSRWYFRDTMFIHTHTRKCR